MMQTHSFDTTSGPKVPHLKGDILNMLKVVDLPMEDKIKLFQMGFEDLMSNPTVMNDQAVLKDAYDLDKEFNDPL